LTTVWSPLEKLNLEKQFDIVAIVRGGGLTGQASVQLESCKIIMQNR
jgi:ribosomal protein S9